MKLKILSIDDEVGITTLMKFMLESYGMDAFIANSGAEGLQIMRTEKIDLVLLDLMMPQMDGWEVARAIRKFSDVPILAFSAVGDREKIATVKESGINDFIEKPETGDVLIEKIYALAQGPGN